MTQVIMLMFPGATQEHLEKMRKEIQDIVDPTEKEYSIILTNHTVEHSNHAYNSAMLCIKFDGRIYEYRAITNKLLQMGDRVVTVPKDIHVVLNVFEDMAMLQQEGLILDHHIECFFGAILRAIIKSKVWMAELNKMKSPIIYNYIAEYLDRYDKLRKLGELGITLSEAYTKVEGKSAEHIILDEAKDEEVE